MNNAFDALPWWLAAVAAMLVGGVSAFAAQGDVWIVLARSGVAFLAFWVIGSVIKVFLSRTAGNPSKKANDSKKRSARRIESSEPSESGAESDAAISGEE